ncbi:hypothetical protein BpHYR1_015117 [Brachionus plicatilis]|uniref:Uncharacterized protein n=1 Tax=Brachionus plicatilis TaxID=10195 RepID=A0A3M7S9Q7_BRAPC|nr:hypothetical protein BpHYR1_015117 [Brachionus plicatilis]
MKFSLLFGQIEVHDQIKSYEFLSESQFGNLYMDFKFVFLVSKIKILEKSIKNQLEKQMINN